AIRFATKGWVRELPECSVGPLRDGFGPTEGSRAGAWATRACRPPRRWRGSVLAAKHPDEVCRVCVPDALGDDVDHLARVEQETSCLGHPPAHDPLARASPRGS